MINNYTKIIDEDLAYIAGADLPWREFEGKNVLITGANGALPAYMAETILYLNDKLFKRKATVFALVRNPAKAKKRFEGYQKNQHLKFIFQDVCDKIIFNESLDYIIHAASQASPKHYGQDPAGTLLPNVLGTYNLLELARQKNIKCFLFFSAGAVYGAAGGNGVLIKEENFGPLNPLTADACYSESKRLGETMCLAWFNQYKVPIKIVRPFHTYGPGIELDDGRVFSDFCNNIINNQNIKMNSDGGAKRTFCYLADAVIGFFTVLLKGRVGQAYNIAGEKATGILELAQILIGFFPEKNLKVIFKDDRDKAPVKTNAPIYGPDITKIKELGWKQKYTVAEGFKRILDDYLCKKVKGN